MRLTFVKLLEPELDRKGLSKEKAYNWFNKNVFTVDQFAEEQGYSDEIMNIFYTEIADLHVRAEEIDERIRNYATINKEYASKFKALRDFWYKKTVDGMLKYCIESENIYECEIFNDKVYRLAWFHYVICQVLNMSFLKWTRNQKGDNMILSIPPQHPLAHSTPILSPNKGWITHGELEVGDQVYGIDGNCHEVLSLTPEVDCEYEVVTSKGDVIKCSGEHIWRVYPKSSNKAWDMTTLEVKDYIDNASKYMYLQLPDYATHKSVNNKAKLEISPYLLGLWLGGYTKSKAYVKLPADKYNPHDELITSHQFKYAYKIPKQPNSRRVEYHWFKESLESLNLINNKHIPDSYATASKKARIELLAGILDSKASLKRKGTEIFFQSRNHKFIKDVSKLLFGLNIRHNLGEEMNHTYNEKMSYIRFVMSSTAERFPCRVFQPPKLKRFVNRTASIKEVRLAKQSEKGRCIVVSSPDSMYLVGERFTPTHNCKSTLTSGALPALMLGNKPHVRGLISGYNEKFAAQLLQKDFMNVVDTKGYTKLFGKIFNANLSLEDKEALRNNGNKPPIDSKDFKGTLHNGGVFAGGLGQLTGKPAKFMIVDDPIPNAAVARSKVEVAKVVEEFDSSASSRMRGNTFMCITQCVTGDTEVSMSDGSSKWLKDLKVGDTIVTHNMETQKPEPKKVLNWCSQGFDEVYEITTKTGKKIKANAKHPFLVQTV